MSNFLSKTPKITVLDAVMGSGKTTRIKDKILNTNKPIIYITPLLEEASSIVGAIVDDKGRQVRDDSGYFMYDLNNPVSSKSFVLPTNNNNNGSKLDNIKDLINRQCNIASTHQLFSMFDLDVINLLLCSDYTLIVDECLNVWSTLNILDIQDTSSKAQIDAEKQEKSSGSKTDREILNLIKNGFIEVDSVGLLHWQTDKYTVDDDSLLMAKVKKLCDLKQLYLSNGRVVYWELNSTIISCFSEIIIGTYMFKYNFMSYYLEVHGYDYSVEKFGHKPSYYKDLINIEQGKLNDIGEKDYSLSYNDLCVKRHTEHPKDTLRKNLDNFLRNKCKSKSGERIWTCFKKVTPSISNRRYTQDWVAYNIKATNKYRHIEHVAYLCNNFPNSFLVAMVTKRSDREFNADMWALQEMLQYVWRSRIRGNELVLNKEDRKINLYVPSKRMRTLLEKWLNDEFEEECDK